MTQTPSKYQRDTSWNRIQLAKWSMTEQGLPHLREGMIEPVLVSQ